MKIARIARSLAFAAAALIVSLAPALAQGNGQTTLEVYNGSNNPVQVYIALNNYAGNNPGFAQNVTTLPWRHDPKVKMVPGNPLLGSFQLRNGDTASLQMPPGQAIAGNFVFASGPPNNCPGSNPNGQNLAEFTINNNTPTFFNNAPPYTQEAVDISCVNGVNAKLQFDLNPSGGSGNWSAGTGFPDVRSFANKKYNPPPTSNANIAGVFGIGCDNCTNNTNPGCGTQWSAWQGCSTNPNCNVQRPGNRSGGTVRITYNGEYPVTASQTSVRGR